MQKNINNNLKIKKLVATALFCALAYATMFFVRIDVQFLTIDIKDAIITMAGLLLGPVVTIVIALVVAFLELISTSGTGFYGFVMNFVGTVAFSFTVALIYKYKNNIKGAVIGLVSGVLVMTLVMIALNFLITPFYMNTTTQVVAGMVLPLLLPFNLLKAVLNSSLVLVLYKPVSKAVKHAGLVRFDENKKPSVSITKSKVNWVVIIAGGVLLVSSVLVLVFVLDGSFGIF